MKQKFSKEICLYLVFGILTTIVYFVVRITVVTISDNYLYGVILGQVAAILFAFITNKYFVFKNKSQGIKEVLKQFTVFVSGRAFVFGLDVMITYLAVEKFSSFFIQLLGLSKLPYDTLFFSHSLTRPFIGTPERLNEFIFALIVQVLAIILNYLISKKQVFKEDNL